MSPPPAIPVELRRAFWDIARDGMAADEPGWESERIKHCM